MTEIEYHLKFPVTDCRFENTQLTFSINHIKSRLTSVLYFILRGYDKTKNNVTFKYTSPRWIIDTDYTRRTHTFEISSDKLEDTSYAQIELVAIGIDSENPLSFTECMLNEGEDMVYCIPHQQVSKQVGFRNSIYANLYDKENCYIQVIRPKGDAIFTDCLKASTCTVLAPHLNDESDIDNPINVFMEFINQTDQNINVLR